MLVGSALGPVEASPDYPGCVEILGLGVDICEIAGWSGRSPAIHPAAARVHARGDRVLRRQGAAGRVVRRPVRGSRGRDQGPRRLPWAGVAGHRRPQASERRPADPADRQREAPRRLAGRRSGAHHVHARAHERRRVRGGGDQIDEAGSDARPGRRAGPRRAGARHVGRGADGAGRPRRRAGGGRPRGRHVRAACGRRVRQGQQRGGRPRGGAAPRTVGDGRRGRDDRGARGPARRRPRRTSSGYGTRRALASSPPTACRTSSRAPTSRSTRSSAPASAACPRTSGRRRSAS